MLEIDTPHGPARAHLHPADGPRAALVLGHGAGGGVTARDLVAATGAARVARGQRRARRAAVPRRRAALARRRRISSTRRGRRWSSTARRRAARAAARRRRPLVGRACRLPHGGGDRRRRRALPRVPAAAAAPRGAPPAPSRLPELDAVGSRCSSCRARATRSACRRPGARERWCRCRATTACEPTRRAGGTRLRGTGFRAFDLARRTLGR